MTSADDQTANALTAALLAKLRASSTGRQVLAGMDPRVVANAEAASRQHKADQRPKT
jgi:hypothetical protein